jgi:hypothetical protein
MDEVSAIVKAIAAVSLIHRHRHNEKHNEIIETLKLSLATAMDDWIQSEADDLL